MIFLLCAYYIVHHFQWGVIFGLLAEVDWRWMPLAVAATIIFFWIFRTVRWFVLLKAAGIEIDFCRLYLIGSMAVALAIVTPLQSGEALKVEFLKRAGSMERVPGYGIFMAERILDFLVVIFIALTSVVFGISRFLNPVAVFFIAALMLISFVVFFAATKRLSPENTLGKFFQPFNQCVRSKKLLLTVVVLTIAGWFFIVLGWYASFRSVSISIGLFETAATMAVTTLLGILSLIPWSLGISEVGISSFLVYFRQSVPLAQTGALIIRIYGIVTLLLGVIHFLIWKFLDRKGAVSAKAG